MEQLRDLRTYLLAMQPSDVLDIVLVASLIYALLYVVRGTRAVQLLRGILLVVLLAYLFSQVVSLPAFRWLVQILLLPFLVSLPVIFQPELRRALERLGRAGLFLSRPHDAGADSIVTVVALAAGRLSESRHGALIVLERETGLDDLVERGVRLDAVATVDLLTQIFYPNSPLHDGAVIIRNGRIAAARVVLPLGDPRVDDRGLGTRHLAALALTESSDALAVIVSEETGIIALARDGDIVRHLDEGELSRLLYRAMAAPSRPGDRILRARGRAEEEPATPPVIADGPGGERVLAVTEDRP
jgi:diadenylate cyclase